MGCPPHHIGVDAAGCPRTEMTTIRVSANETPQLPSGIRDLLATRGDPIMDGAFQEVFILNIEIIWSPTD
jgi:hypothetical protein